MLTSNELKRKILKDYKIVACKDRNNEIFYIIKQKKPIFWRIFEYFWKYIGDDTGPTRFESSESAMVRITIYVTVRVNKYSMNTYVEVHDIINLEL